MYYCEWVEQHPRWFRNRNGYWMVQARSMWWRIYTERNSRMRYQTRRLGNRYLRLNPRGLCVRRNGEIVCTNIRILFLQVNFNTVKAQMELYRKQYRWRVQIASCAHSECSLPYPIKATPIRYNSDRTYTTAMADMSRNSRFICLVRVSSSIHFLSMVE